MFGYLCLCFFFFKQKTAYEMRISDWSSDVCSSDLGALAKLAKIEVACRCCGIDQWVEPKAEDVGDRLFNVGKTVVRAASEIGERRPATDRQAQSGIDRKSTRLNSSH